MTSNKGLRVAIVDDGPMGGTCLNRGCIPSKVILHSADVAETIDTAKKFGIISKGYKVDFAKVTQRASQAVDKDSREIEESIKRTENMELFKKKAKFVSERTLSVGNKEISGKKVVVAAGTRPTVPPIDGIKNVKFMTSDDALRLTKQPKSIIILGGGFIAAELAHFFGGLGTKVTILQRSSLLKKEDREISDTYTRVVSKKYNVVLGYSAKNVKKIGNKITVTAESKDGKSKKKLEAESLLVATGRVPNTDVLDVKKGGIEVNDRGYIKVNKFLETSAPNTWALGDIVGNYLLKHSANLEAEYVWHNAFGKKKIKIDYWPMPHAIFSSPQIAAVGFTEEQLKEKNIHYVVGKYTYEDSGMGLALDEKDGFVKILVDNHSRKILGCHIIGPDASILIHEVVVAMKAGLTVEALTHAIHVHPALSEVVQRAALNIG